MFGSLSREAETKARFSALWPTWRATKDVLGWRANKRSRAAMIAWWLGKSLPWNDQSGWCPSSSHRSFVQSMGRKNASGSETWMKTGSLWAAQASHIGSKRGSSTSTRGPSLIRSRRNRPRVLRTLSPRAPALAAFSIASAWICE